MRRQSAKVLLAGIASRQWGRVTWAQVESLGVDDATVSCWLKQGYLHRRFPGVYAVGHRSGEAGADLAAALLYAGPGAMLSHSTAAWWWGLLDSPPSVIHVSTPRRCRGQPGLAIHQRRRIDRVWHRRLPVTPIAQTLLDLAGVEPLRTVRRALAKADYARRLDVRSVEAALGAGRPGSAILRRALERHQPALARTKSDLEVSFLELCESAGLRLPELNVRVAGWEIDAVWRREWIAVELDGIDNHRTPAQVKRDRRKELALRGAGFTPLRYSDEQVRKAAATVIADLRRSGIAGPV